MRRLEESRDEFNLTMQDYVAIVVQTEHTRFSHDFLVKNKLIIPSYRTEYVPPSWVGAEYSPDFNAVYGLDIQPKKKREETIPPIAPVKKYLICDDYSDTGDTLEIVIIRLVQQGLQLNGIWGLTARGNREIENHAVLDRSSEWLDYRKRQDSTTRIVLEELGFIFPSI